MWTSYPFILLLVLTLQFSSEKTLSAPSSCHMESDETEFTFHSGVETPDLAHLIPLAPTVEFMDGHMT